MLWEKNWRKCMVFDKLSIFVGHFFMVFDGFFETQTWNSWISPKMLQLQTAVTLCLLNRFQNSWYLGYLARAETSENDIYNRIFQVLSTHRIPNVSWFFEKSTSNKQNTWYFTPRSSPPVGGIKEFIFLTKDPGNQQISRRT